MSAHWIGQTSAVDKKFVLKNVLIGFCPLPVDHDDDDGTHLGQAMFDVICRAELKHKVRYYVHSIALFC